MDDWEIKTILLGYDGSKGADEAARLAGAIARRNNARIVVHTAFHGVRRDVMGDKRGRRAHSAEETAREMVLKLQAAGIKAESDVMEGDAGETLVLAITGHNADLVVVGRRGHGRLGGLLLGSTSEYVVRRAKVPVLVG